MFWFMCRFVVDSESINSIFMFFIFHQVFQVKKVTIECVFIEVTQIRLGVS